MLDEAGLGSVAIFASSGLDEDKVDHLVSNGAPITGFGVGTNMGVSEDAPSLDVAYKLSAYAGKGRLKLSTGKPTFPGGKQVFRIEEDGRAVRDVIARAEEHLEGRPLLRCVMRDGRRLPEGSIDLNGARRRACDELTLLPEHVRALPPADPPYPVIVSPALRAYRDEVVAQLAT
jgi:nicotinate phosphoribosyltransferase